MAISLTTLNGTDSLAATRITINDNFSTLQSALNKVLSMLDIATGLFDNSSFGSNSNITTQNINIVGTVGVTVATGDIVANLGSVKLGGYLEFGAGSGVKIKKSTIPNGTGNTFVLDAAGATANNLPGTVGYFVIPRLTTANYSALQNPDLGALVYDIATNKLMVCTSTSATIGATGTWTIVGSQS